MFSHHLSCRLGPCTLDLPGARASLTLVERTKTPYLPSRVKPFLMMWAIWILRSYIDHCAHPLSDLVAERKFHGLSTLYIRDWILPFVPSYSHKGLLGMSSGRDQVPWEVPLLVMASGWDFVYGSDMPQISHSEEASETGEKNGQTEGHSGLTTGFRKLVNCSPGNRRDDGKADN